jgi:hypothetical protein
METGSPELIFASYSWARGSTDVAPRPGADLQCRHAPRLVLLLRLLSLRMPELGRLLDRHAQDQLLVLEREDVHLERDASDRPAFRCW